MRSSSRQALSELLEAYTGHELLRLLRSMGEERVCSELPDPATVPPQEFLAAFLDACERRDLLRIAALWRGLLQLRPQMHAQIEQVERGWLAPPAPVLARWWRVVATVTAEQVLLAAALGWLIAVNARLYSVVSFEQALPLDLRIGLLAFTGLSMTMVVALSWRPALRGILAVRGLWRDDLKLPAAVDPELRRVAVLYFTAARRNIVDHPTGRKDILYIPECVVMALGTPAEPQDAHRLGGALGPRERGFFVHRGRLSPRVEEILNGLRLEGHPVASISFEAMRMALADGTVVRSLNESEVFYFRQQNFFSKKNAIVDGHFFFGREDLLTRVGSALADGDAVMLRGLRKSGKTSFLHMLRTRMPTRPWCHIDAQRFSKSSDWPLVVAKELVAAIDQWARLEVGSTWPLLPSPERLDQLAGALEVRREELARRGRHERPILVLDEFERLFPRADDMEGAARLIEAGVFRAAAQTWLAIIAADLRAAINDTNNLPNHETNPFYRFFQEFPLPMFTLDEMGQMIRTIGQALGMRHFDPSFVSGLHSFSGGHPGLARDIAARARELQADMTRFVVDDLTRAIHQLHLANVLGSFFSENLWGPATPSEQAVLRWLTTGDGPRRQRDAPSELQDPCVWAELQNLGLVQRDNENGNEETRWVIAMDGFSRWIRQRTTVEASQDVVMRR